VFKPTAGQSSNLQKPDKAKNPKMHFKYCMMDRRLGEVWCLRNTCIYLPVDRLSFQESSVFIRTVLGTTKLTNINNFS